jgi:hypothetical protein
MTRSMKIALAAMAVLAAVTVVSLGIRDRGARSGDSAPRLSADQEVPATTKAPNSERMVFTPASVLPAGRPIPKYNPAVMEEINGLQLRDSMPELMKRAQRDPSTAYALALSLAQCAMADSAYQGLASSAEQMGGPAKLEARMKEYEKTFAKCQGVTSKNLELRFDLTTSAANAGLVEAQLQYRATGAEYVLSEEALRRPSVAQEYHRNAISYINRAAASGDPNALMAAFSLYSDGMLLPPDRAVAYRYLKAYAQANPNGPAQNLLASYTRQLTPEELQRATR